MYLLSEKEERKTKKWILLCNIYLLGVLGSLIIGCVVSRFGKAEVSTDSLPEYIERSNSNRTYRPTNYIKSDSKTRSSDRTNDDEYWASVSRQKALEDMGMDDAAKIERNARLKYVQGGGYHSKDGSSQVRFQGSKEQAEQLRMMDKMGW